MTAALERFAEFFGIDPDLVRTAAERGADRAMTSKDDLREMLAVIPDSEKIEMLLSVVESDTSCCRRDKEQASK